jgi:lipopolysaccharide export system permease protein
VRRLDRYILGQLVRAFGFFALIFTGVVWLTQAVRLLDTVVLSGQGARVFLEFSALVLPQVFMIVLPLAGLGAALFTINKLYTEAELVVMMAAGAGPLDLARPVAAFGAGLCLLMGLITLVLVPLGGAALADRTQEIRSDLVNSLIVERQFLHPMPGLTLFIADTSSVGEMAGLFLHDERVPAQAVTYTAERALLLREGMEARLVMLDGVALTRTPGPALNSVTFEQFVFDLTGLIESQGPRNPRPSEYALGQLLDPTQEMLGRGNYTRASYISEGHWKLALPLLSILYPMVALVTLIGRPYRRGGFGARVVLAIAVSIALYAIVFVARSRVQVDAGLWPVIYLAHLLGLGYIVVATARIAGRLRGREAPA